MFMVFIFMDETVTHEIILLSMIGEHMPQITVLLPAWNALATLPRAVESIRTQTFRDWELLVINDGSTDGSTEWLDAIASRDDRIRVIHAPHRGLVATLNEGLHTARGTWIARMDADDESFPNRLADQAALLESDPDLGVVGCRIAFGGDRHAAGGYARHVDWLNSVLTPQQIAIHRFVESPFAHPSVLFRRACVEQHGGYRDGPFPEDYELWLRWLEAGVRMAKHSTVGLRWNDPPQRLSRTDPRYATDAFFTLKAGFLSNWLRAHLRPNRPLWVWGAGRPTRRRAALLEPHGLSIAGYIDIDPAKIGRRLHGRTVIAPSELPPPGAVFVIGFVTNPGARDLQRACLENRGYQEGIDFLFAA
jgi:cellulose synthase/poly-beta-1,6-N-acetylglucosamine synthase-like glycosyltransferase